MLSTFTLMLLPILSAPASTATPEVVELSLSREHACARTRKGEVWCWGNNEHAQLGRGDQGMPTGRPAPIPGITDAMGVAAAGIFTCVLRRSGEMKCWGGWLDGEGKGKVLEPSGITRLFSGESVVCAADAKGARCYGVMSWDAEHKAERPVDFGVTGKITSMVFSSRFACASLARGEVWCRGTAPGGPEQKDYTPHRLPVEGVERITGTYQSLCMRKAGTWSCQGGEADGQPKAPFTGKEPLVARDGRSCAVISGRVQCWGSNYDFSNGERVDEGASPPIEGITDATGVALGGQFTCALRAGGRVSCWGKNEDAQLGDGRPWFRMAPEAAQGISDVVRLRGGWHETCAQTAHGEVRCWGDNGKDKSGIAKAGFWGAVSTFDMAYGTICALVSGRPSCGYFSYDGWSSLSTPSLTTTARDIALNRIVDVCVIDKSRHVRCIYGQGEAGGWSSWKQVPKVKGATALAGGVETMCALVKKGKVWCWRDHRFDGDEDFPTKKPDPKPVIIKGLPPMKQLTGGIEHCGVSKKGEVWCWYFDANWGEPQMKAVGLRKVEALSPAVEVQRDDQLLCSRAADGRVRCMYWGKYLTGIPYGEREKRLNEVTEVPGPSVTLGVGHEHACMARPKGEVLCWGVDDMGQLGTGRVMATPVPVDVRFGR
ncbi:MAG: RCC1 domain-containing protein [Bradymonadia bacterium]